MTSIIDAKYRDKYRNHTNWLKATIDAAVNEPITKEKEVKAEDGTTSTEVVTLKGTRLNLDKLFNMAEVNNISVDKYKADADKKNAPGRLRMTIGNMLAAAAKKRHGLYVPTEDGSEWVDADAEYIGDSPLTHNRDGSKIAKAKPEGEADAGEGEAAA